MAVTTNNLNRFLPIIIFMISFSSMSQNPIYVGTYTKKEGHVDGKAEGIYLLYQDLNSGKLSEPETVAEITNPSFVKASEDGENLYAVSELGSNDEDSGFVYSFKRNADNSLEELGKISTESYAPCHIEIDKTGKFVFVSNYVGGVVMVYKRAENGILEKIQKLQLENPEKSNAHSVSISSNNKFAYVADLGNDKIWIFELNAETGKLIPHNQPFVKLEKGAGPRHFTFSEDEHFAYSINELNSSISVFKKKKNGGLELVENVNTLPEDFLGKNSTADIHLHPSGRFLYVSNRGHNSIAAFSANKDSGKLKEIGHFSTNGKTPRNFAISADGNFLYAANQDSGNVVGFEINIENGELQEFQNLEVKSPVCLEIPTSK